MLTGLLRILPETKSAWRTVNGPIINELTPGADSARIFYQVELLPA